MYSHVLGVTHGWHRVSSKPKNAVVCTRNTCIININLSTVTHTETHPKISDQALEILSAPTLLHNRVHRPTEVSPWLAIRLQSQKSCFVAILVEINQQCLRHFRQKCASMVRTQKVLRRAGRPGRTTGTQEQRPSVHGVGQPSRRQAVVGAAFRIRTYAMISCTSMICT